MIDIIRHKQVSLNDLQEGEYVINEFGGKIKGVLKLNGKLHNTIFNEESNKAPLKSEQNDIVINDGVNDRVIIGDIGKTKDGKLYGMKVSKVGSDARFASENKLLINTAKNFLWPTFASNQSTSADGQALTSGNNPTIQFDEKSYDNGNNFNTSNYSFTAPYNGIYHFNARILLDGDNDGDSGDYDAGEQMQIRLNKNDRTANADTSKVIIISRFFIFTDLEDKFMYNTVAGDIKLDADDYVSVSVFQNSGVTQSTYADTSSTFTAFTGHLVCLT